MASALFVFDHKYPCDLEGKLYYSSGFDEDFFDRYYRIFNRFDILGRKNIITVSKNKAAVSYPSRFYLFESNKAIWKSRKTMEMAINQVDCVICRMPSIFGALAIRIAKRAKKPYIVEVVSCEYDALSVSPSLLRRLFALPAEYFYRIMLRNNPYSIYVTKSFLQKKYPSKGKQVAISNVTIPELNEDTLLTKQKRYSAFEKEGKIVIGTCSTLNVDFKGQQYVIKAISFLKKKGLNVEYQLVGDGEGEWLLKIAKNCGVEDEVHIIGHLDHSDVFRWLDDIDIYVHPSCQEGLSRAIIEAMSRACPIIGADTGGIHELIDEQFIVPKRNSKAIASSIEKMLNNNMKEQSKKNYTNANEFLKDILYSKRESFYNAFLEDNGLK